MTTGAQHVLLVDDDAAVLKSLERLLKLSPYTTHTFTTGEAFLERPRPAGPACAVIDLRLPDINGLELQERMSKGEIDLPLIFLTGHGGVDSAVGAMKRGAVDFLTKQVDEANLLSAIERAIARDVQRQADRQRVTAASSRIQSLTDRQREVLRLVLTGMLNKQIAAQMGITEKTVKVHRGVVMEKMQVRSVAELVRLAAASGIEWGAAISKSIEPTTA
jgi:FixJ family two-component response regulator